jgi:WD40 repeat protein
LERSNLALSDGKESSVMGRIRIRKWMLGLALGGVAFGCARPVGIHPASMREQTAQPPAKEGIRPSEEAGEAQVKGWIDQLGDPEFAKRDEAFERLFSWAKRHPAEAKLWVPMRDVDPEVNDRLYKLWARIQNNPVPALMEDDEMVFAVAYSPDGTSLASAAGKEIKLWDMESYQVTEKGELLRRFSEHTGWVNSAAISPDGRWLVSGTQSGQALLWEIDRETSPRTLVSGWWGKVCVAFSPDGQTVAIGGRDGSVGEKVRGTIVLWDMKKGEERGRIASPSAVFGIAFSPDGKKLASAGRLCIKQELQDDGMLKTVWQGRSLMLWDVQSCSEIGEFAVNQGFESVAYSPDGKRVIAGGSNQVIVCDTETLRGVRSFHPGYGGSKEKRWVNVRSVALDPEGKRVAATSQTGHVMMWEVESGKEVWEGNAPRFEEVFSCVFSPDGRWLAIGCRDRRIRIIEAATGRVLGEETVVGGVEAIRTIPGRGKRMYEVVYSPDGKLLASAEEAEVVLREVETGEEVRVYTKDAVREAQERHPDMQYGFTGVAFSPDGKLLAAGSWSGLAALWEVETGKELPLEGGAVNHIFSVVFSPDGKYLVAGSWSGQTLVWEVETGKFVRELRSKRGVGEHSIKPNIHQVVFSSDGKRMATASFDGTVRIWNTETWKEEQALVGHTDRLRTVAFSPDGKQVATAGHDRRIKVWDVGSGKEEYTISSQTGEGHMRGSITSVVFSPDGSQLLSGGMDGTIRMWDPVTGKQRQIFKGYVGGRLRYSPDGKTFIAPGEGGSIQMWPAEPPEE